VTLTEHKRHALQRIARELARDDPRLARLLTKPTRLTRRARRRRRLTALALALALALATLATLAILAFSLYPTG
jgi:ferric-dicitrate binding protein FerR (iron transport regulator)